MPTDRPDRARRPGDRRATSVRARARGVARDGTARAAVRGDRRRPHALSKRSRARARISELSPHRQVHPSPRNGSASDDRSSGRQTHPLYRLHRSAGTSTLRTLRGRARPAFGRFGRELGGRCRRRSRAWRRSGRVRARRFGRSPGPRGRPRTGLDARARARTRAGPSAAPPNGGSIGRTGASICVGKANCCFVFVSCAVSGRRARW
jgi:hypothetical protein